MKKILQLIGACCLGAALVSGDVYGVQETKEPRELQQELLGKLRKELLNPEVMQKALLELVGEIDGSSKLFPILKYPVLKEKAESFVDERCRSLARDCSSFSSSCFLFAYAVNELIYTTFRATRGLINSSALTENSTSILLSTCYCIIHQLLEIIRCDGLSPNLFVELLELSWGNPELVKTAELVMCDAEQVIDNVVHHHSINSDYSLTKYLRDLIFKDPGKYDAAIRGWIEENNSKDWHSKWESFLELSAFNESGVIESLKTILREDKAASSKMDGINAITSLVGFLKFDGHH
jgi:hypothetical protein